MEFHVAISPRVLGRVLIGFGLLYIVALGGMALVFSANPPTDLIQQFDKDQEIFQRYSRSFMLVILLGPSLVTMITAAVTAKWLQSGVQFWDILGLLFLFAYIPFQSIAYGSQFTILPHLLASDVQSASQWYLHNPHSIAYAVDLLGYAIFGVAAIFLSVGMWRTFKGYGIFLFVCGLTSVVAYACVGFGLGALAGVLSLISAGFTIPILILSIQMGINLLK